MKRIDVTKAKDGTGWEGRSGGQRVSSGRTKDEAVKNTAKVAKADPNAVSVKVHKEDGRIQEERTYPGKADPRKSKG
jgi:hypothetical protein